MWYEDIINDLAAQTGVHTRDLDENYILRGNRPPPPLQLSENIIDEEIKLRFGHHGQPTLNDNSSPDLAGITKMLRMVDTFDKPEMKDKPQENEESPTIIISKLNPHVQEFVPQTLVTNTNEEAVKNNAIDVELENNNNDMNGVTTKESKINVAIENGKITSQNENTPSPAQTTKINEEIEKEKLVEVLKRKIITSSKDSTPAQKKERNVAMAALLRLKTGPPTPINVVTPNSTPSSGSPQLNRDEQQKIDEQEKTESPKPILFTPDYFAGPSSPKVVKVDDKEHKLPEPIPEPIPEPSPLESPVQTPSPKQMLDPQMKESIEKVNKWLSNPKKKPKPRALAPQMGPIIFKRKENVSPKSPSSEISKISKKSEPDIVRGPAEFVPSPYASQLAERFRAQVTKAKEEEAKREKAQEGFKNLEEAGLSFTYTIRKND